MRMVSLLLALVATPAWAEPLHFTSGNEQTVMIELYTSEGCSSCPPAEAYLNGYLDDPDLWSRYIPLAFHVDYWDYLGWKDRFALPGSSQRQRAYARARGSRTVYTPALFVNGDPMRPGARFSRPGPSGAHVGNLQVWLDGRRLQATFTPAADRPVPGELHVAFLGTGLTSDIQAGENRGRQSRHEFVVLKHLSARGDSGSWQLELPRVEHHDAARLALVVWVAEPRHPRPIQATGGFIPTTALQTH